MGGPRGKPSEPVSAQTQRNFATSYLGQSNGRGSLRAPRRSRVMHSPLYYLSQATIARRLASKVTNEGVSEFLNQTAKDYADIALDLEAGVIEIRHPDVVRQQR